MEQNLTFSHHALHSVRMLRDSPLQSIERPGKVRSEVPVEVHHVGRQVIRGRSLQRRRTLHRTGVNSIVTPLTPVSQQQESRCVQGQRQQFQWAHIVFGVA